jgi:lipopolysaccharide transport system ATP-binding protein
MSTIFHITQYKAGSQWIHQILLRCAAPRIVSPKLWAAHFLQDRIIEGGIYPTVYVTKEEYEDTPKPPGSASFVILRDLRDIAVSAYFSIKFSHPEIGRIGERRKALVSRDVENGYIWLFDNWMHYSAKIGRSWVESGEDWIRYEDLLENDVALLEHVLIDRCRLEISRDRFREAVASCRFDKLSGGRPRGVEDPYSHARKGVSGDWSNHFTPRIKREFKERFGDILIRSGYERDYDW